MSKESVEEYKALMEERRSVPFSRRERVITIVLPIIVSYLHLKIAQLNGEGYKLKVQQYWRALSWKYATLLLISFAWAFAFRFTDLFSLAMTFFIVSNVVTGVYLLQWIVRRLLSVFSNSR